MIPTSNIIKIYDWFLWDMKFQVDSFNRIEIRKDVTDISTATIQIQIKSWLQMLDRISIYEACTTEDILIFDWYITSIEANIHTLTVEVIDWKAVLKKKRCLDEITNTNGVSAINSLISLWNNTTWENLSLETNESFTGKYNFSKWSDFYSCIESVIWEDAFFDFDISSGKIRISKVLGKNRDKTYTYSLYHQDSNITNIETSITENIHTHTRNFETNITETIQANNKYGILMSDKKDAEKNWISQEHDISIVDNTLEAGDVFTLEVIGKNYNEQYMQTGWSTSQTDILISDYISYYGQAYVLREEITIEWGKKQKTLEVWTKIKKKQTLTDLLLANIK